MRYQYEDVIGRLGRLEDIVKNLEERINRIQPIEGMSCRATPVLSKPSDEKHVVTKCATGLSAGERSFVETEEARAQLTNVRSQIDQAESKSRGLKRRRSERKRKGKSNPSLRKRILNKLTFL